MQWEYHTPFPRGWEYFSPPARLLRLGLDAPARPALMFDPDTLAAIFSSSAPEGPFFPWLPRTILGFYMADYLFLIGTAITWYFVGRAVDRRIGGVRGDGSNRTLALGYLFLFALGVLLFAVGFHDLGPNRAESTIPPVGAIFSLIWAVVLVFIPIRGTIRVVQARRLTGGAVSS